MMDIEYGLQKNNQKDLHLMSFNDTGNGKTQNMSVTHFQMVMKLLCYGSLTGHYLYTISFPKFKISMCLINYSN